MVADVGRIPSSFTALPLGAGEDSALFFFCFFFFSCLLFAGFTYILRKYVAEACSVRQGHSFV